MKNTSTSDNKLDFFSTLDKLLIVTEIINEVSKLEYNTESYTVDFSIKEGKMVCSKNWNTCIKFDVTDSPNLRKIIDFLSSDDTYVSPDTITNFDNFRKQIGETLCNTFNKDLASIIVSNVFGIKYENSLPMKCVEIDISDKPEIDYLLVISKMTPPGVQTEPVTEELFKIHLETGREPNEIIEEFKKNNDPRFKYVKSCEKRKHFFEFSIYWMIDYSRM